MTYAVYSDFGVALVPTYNLARLVQGILGGYIRYQPYRL